MIEHQKDLSYDDRIAQVRKRFIHTLKDRLDDVLNVVQGEPESSGGETHVRKVHRLLHDMSGNAAMLELDTIEQIVRKGVDIAEHVDTTGADLTQTQITALEAIIQDAHAAAAQLREHYSTL
ncbi:chemotaxis protein histidine kinase CheA [Loktanella ponticola]|uniref:Chemotaxis protein histidine kinase CheA n=1 Tax=Yoonia ponticola TaxID=1524255 RepID=A0A7W9EZ73_9RHOB|nr:Hpt domain-containing protein [Yoonia ponticola]MBB5721855.1 chemotaxis protein histidine kinase CheA [Yoonia ponticola]